MLRLDFAVASRSVDVAEQDAIHEAEVRESHEQLSETWGLFARCSRDGEVADTDGLRLANPRQPWFLMNAAVLTQPVSAQADLEARATMAIHYFGSEPRPWIPRRQ